MTVVTPRSGANVTAPDLARFAGVRAWIFDLDNTLYPSGNGVFPQVQARIGEYVQRLFNITPEAAHKIQRDLLERYGATLPGLVAEHGIDADAFLEYVHDIDHSMLKPDPRLASAIGSLPGRRFILTNGSRSHAEKVAAALGFTSEFEDVFDIVWAGHLPKPSPQVYDQLIRQTKIEPAASAMFEDLTRNLIVPRRLGMAATLVVPPGTAGIFGETMDRTGKEGLAEEVDFVTDDLAGFLEAVLAVERGPHKPDHQKRERQ